MSHRATADFWRFYDLLQDDVRQLADKNFQLLKADPRHPSLRLKKIGTVWSARVGKAHRALAYEDSVGLVWFWIGTHAQYDRIIARPTG